MRRAELQEQVLARLPPGPGGRSGGGGPGRVRGGAPARPKPSLLANYVWAALAGTTWYFQFFFYGMGTTQMGKYDFSSWTIHMAFIITFSSLWGIYFHEWKGTGRPTRRLVVAGIAVLILSTVVVGAGNYIATLK